MALNGAQCDILVHLPTVGSLRERLAAAAPRCDLLLMTLPHASAVGAATVTPCLNVLVHLASHPSGPQNGRTGFTPHSRILAAFQAELQRLKRLVGDQYSDLLTSIAQLGEQLPPTGSADGDSSEKDSTGASKADDRPQRAMGADAAASAAGTQHTMEQLAALEKHCHDDLSADLLALDEFVHASAAALAQAAAVYDAAVAKATGSSTSTAAAAADGAPMRKGSMQKDATLAPVVQLTAVCSHAARPAAAAGSTAAGSAGQRYTASLPQDAYHQALYQLVAKHIGPGGSTDAVLWGLSVLYARLRHRREALARVAAAANEAAAGAADAQEAGWVAPDRFIRNTTKYWVHPSNVLRLKLACACHLPVLVYGKASPIVTGDTSPEALRKQAAEATSLINSVYFDNQHCDVYHRRLLRDNDAQLVRLRWYGHCEASTSSAGSGSSGLSSVDEGRRAKEPTVFVERKTHKEPWTGMSSIKERVALPKASAATEPSATANGEPAATASGGCAAEHGGPGPKSPVAPAPAAATANGSPPVDHAAAAAAGANGKPPGKGGGKERKAPVVLEAAAAGANSGLPAEHAAAAAAADSAGGVAPAKGGAKERKEAVKRHLLDDVQHYITSLGQVPVLRTEYYRTAFQAYDCNDVRVSLDTDMLMIREHQGGCTHSMVGQQGQQWQQTQQQGQQQQQQQQQPQQQQQGQQSSQLRSAQAGLGSSLLSAPGPLGLSSLCGVGGSLHGHRGPLGAGDVVRFPYAVLEVKLQQKAPEWIKELRRSDLLVEINGFSKFLHASALLYPDAVHASPPWFVPDAATRTMTPATLQEMADTSDKFELEAAPWLFPEDSSSSSGSNEANAAAPSHARASSGISGWLRRMLPLGSAAIASAESQTAGADRYNQQPAPHQAAQEQQGRGVQQLQAGAPAPSLQQLRPLQPPAPPSQPVDTAYRRLQEHQGQQGQQGRRQLVGSRGSSDSARANDGGSARGTPPSHSSLITASVASSQAMQWHSQAQPAQQQLQLPQGQPQLPQHPLQLIAAQEQARLHAAPLGSGNEQTLQQGPNRQQQWQEGQHRQEGQQQPLAEPGKQASADTSPASSDNGRPAGCGVRVAGLVKVDSTTMLLPDTIKSHEAPLPAQALWLDKDAGKAGGAGDIETGPAMPAGEAEAGQDGGKKSRGVKAVGRRLKTWLRRGKGPKEAQGEPNEHMTGMKGGPRASALVRTRIEPKTFFAAERTYLAWMHIAVLIMLTGLGLLTGATLVVNKNGQADCDVGCKASQISGTIITPVAIVFMAYGLFMYRKRSIQIMRRQTVRYDDQRGPVVLTLLLIAVTAVSLALAVHTMGTPRVSASPSASPSGGSIKGGKHSVTGGNAVFAPASPDQSPGASPVISPMMAALGATYTGTDYNGSDYGSAAG